MIAYLKNRWAVPNGYKAILTMAFPLILSSSSWAIQTFVDRMFLTWYSNETIAAAMPSGLLNFTLLCFFIGTAGYVTTFVAQYKGAGQPRSIGPVLWQSLYISVVGGALIMCTMPFSDMIFSAIGHGDVIARNESIYYFWLCTGAIPAIMGASLSGFFSGIGRTWPVMWINVIATGINILGDYLLIFGKFGLPEMGIRGAAIATAFSALFGMCAYCLLVFTAKHEKEFAVKSGWRFNRALLKRLFRFGAPSGAQFFLDVAGFTAFIIIVGALGKIPLAATNITFAINTLAFMPTIGIAITITIFVGQNMGARDIQGARRATWSGFHCAFAYMFVIALLYVLIPEQILWLFTMGKKIEDIEQSVKIAATLLRYVAIYTIFDSLNMVFGSAIKGAGDTKYVMISNIILSVFVLVVPSYLMIHHFNAGIFSVWYVATIYIIVLGFNFLIRFLSGAWTTKRVIEDSHPPMPGCCPPEVPMVD
jgi:MATE family multidrug resistance protein